MSSAASPVPILPGTVTKSLMFFSGGAHPALAEGIAAQLGTSVTPQTAHTFANGENFVRFDESVRGCHAFVLQAPTVPINTWLMEQLIMVDALKRASARRVTVLLPFYPYARQDKKHRGREPISARLVADLLATAGTDRIVTVDLHTAQAQGFFDGPVDHLRAQPMLAEYVRGKYAEAELTVVAPDSGRVKLAETWSELLGDRPIAFIQRRDSLLNGRAEANQVVGDVRGRVCVVVDDMIDTGATMTGAAKLLRAEGAADVIAAATHGVLSGLAARRLETSEVREVVLTDTLPIPPSGRFPQLTVLSIAPLLGRAVQEVFDEGSVTSLFGSESPR
ncbi:ribose-phosphate diphosphokinase [Amycolatopsis nigrescens]|uniref:ribose-phosphate diphosphokinase n=1 Tax=Amycolatopsis nigrescens TaxID=381445 RepID=UPI000364B8A5|nr:ribose-phosphate diphosphokinase [Amycolatopsis nigrescens]